jgi:hypothetical protein
MSFLQLSAAPFSAFNQTAHCNNGGHTFMGYDPNQPPYGTPNQPPYGVPPQTPYGVPPQTPPPYGGIPNLPSYGGVPPYAQPPVQKRSLKWLWITLGIVVGIFVLTCGGLAVLGGTLLGGPSSAADSYYKAIESQDYNTAYSYLKVDTFTVGGQPIQANAGVFTQIGNALDKERGKVTKHSVGSINTNNDTSTVKVEVTRNGTPYTVTLELTKIGSDWKITKLDNV